VSRHSPPPRGLFGLLRSRFKRGWKVTRQEVKILPRIVEWIWPFTQEAPQPVPVHILIGRDDWLQAGWTLASWFYFTECNWSVVIHDDGTLPEEAAPALKTMFGDIRIISRSEADAALTPVLRAYPFCAEYRQKHPYALKVFDIPHFAKGQRFLVFDSDLLFFNHPREVLDWTRDAADELRFAEDAQENAPITAGEAKSELGIKLWPRVDSGLCLLTKSIINLELCDEALAQTSLLSGDLARVEQTLLMLCAARHGKGGLLPRTYEVSYGKEAAPSAVARHYVPLVRDQFYSEGLTRLAPVFFPPDKV
jgi:hypothetical protein